MQDFIDDYEHVSCRECGKKFKQITTEHLGKHGMNLEIYQQKYPGVQVTSQKTLDIRKQKQGGDKHPWVGRKHTQETKQKLREAQLKNNAVRGKHLSEEHRQKISEALTGITRSEETKEKLRRYHTGLKASDSTKIKMAKVGRKRFEQSPEEFRKKMPPAKPGKEHFNYGKPTFSHPRHKYTRHNGKEILLRSTWELAVCRYLDEGGYEWEYEFKRYELEDITYCPDFHIFNIDGTLNKIVEVKGWMNDISTKQLEQFSRCYPDIPLEIWDKEQLLSKGIFVK